MAPPEVTIQATYPGASAKVVEDSVTQVVEQQMNGIDNLLYITSTSDSAGNAQIAITFAPGTNPDIAQVQVQNKLQLATPLLPQEVQQQGVQVTKSSDSFLMVMAFNFQGRLHEPSDLADSVAANVQDPMSRVQGVGQIQLFGSQYAMRIWLNPDDLNQYNLTPADVVAAVEAQNSAGGRRPAGRRAGGGRPAAERVDHRADAAGRPGRVQTDSAARQRRRLAGVAG